MSVDVEKQFWQELTLVAKELIEQGDKTPYGNAILEIKYMDGVPFVLIQSKSERKKYPDDAAAMIDIAHELNTATKTKYTGSRTLTVMYHEGKISSVVWDNTRTMQLAKN